VHRSDEGPGEGEDEGETTPLSILSHQSGDTFDPAGVTLTGSILHPATTA